MKGFDLAADCDSRDAFLGPRSFFAAVPMGWEFSRARLIRWGERWEREEAINDLRWWEDMIRMKVALQEERRPRKVMPSERELASWWGWSKQSARRLLQARHTWADPAHSARPAPVRRRSPSFKPSICASSGPPMDQQWGSSGPAVGHLVTGETGLCCETRAPMDHRWTTDGPAVGRHTRASSQDTDSQDTDSQREREGVEEIPPPRRVSSVPPSFVSSASKAGRSTWTADQVLRVWADAWRATDRGNPCRGRKDSANAGELAKALHSLKIPREAFQLASESFLRAQAAGDAFPASGVPLVGHFKRVWRDYLPGARSAPQPRPRPWLTPYTSSPAPMWAIEDARQWLSRNSSEVDLIWEAIRKDGGGEAELRSWLDPRVALPDDVLTALREVA